MYRLLSANGLYWVMFASDVLIPRPSPCVDPVFNPNTSIVWSWNYRLSVWYNTIVFMCVHTCVRCIINRCKYYLRSTLDNLCSSTVSLSVAQCSPHRLPFDGIITFTTQASVLIGHSLHCHGALGVHVMVAGPVQHIGIPG